MKIKGNTDNKTCCFMGCTKDEFRYIDESKYDKLKNTLINIIKKHTEDGVNHYISRLSMGMEIVFIEALIKSKNKFPQIIIETCLPSAEEISYWNESEKIRYKLAVENCSIFFSINSNYSVEYSQRLRDYMLNSANYVIAVWNGEMGDTATLIRSARYKGKKITCVNPDKLTVRRILNPQIIKF